MVLTVADLIAFAPTIDANKAQAMIDDAMALAVGVAPCLLDPAFPKTAEAKAILRLAVLRRNESGTGATQSWTAGPFAGATKTDQPAILWASELQALAALCQSVRKRRVGMGWLV